MCKVSLHLEILSQRWLRQPNTSVKIRLLQIGGLFIRICRVTNKQFCRQKIWMGILSNKYILNWRLRINDCIYFWHKTFSKVKIVERNCWIPKYNWILSFTFTKLNFLQSTLLSATRLTSSNIVDTSSRRCSWRSFDDASTASCCWRARSSVSERWSMATSCCKFSTVRSLTSSFFTSWALQRMTSNETFLNEDRKEKYIDRKSKPICADWSTVANKIFIMTIPKLLCTAGFFLNVLGSRSGPDIWKLYLGAKLFSFLISIFVPLALNLPMKSHLQSDWRCQTVDTIAIRIRKLSVH